MASLIPQVLEPTQVLAGAYLHVPFCAHKCHYCDFYSLVDRPDGSDRPERMGAFVERMTEELGLVAGLIQAPLEAIFIGGGTPTLLPPASLKELLAAVRRSLPVGPDVEITIEANPETVTEEVAEILGAAGVNRVSLGSQSFDPRHLKTLERWHDPENVGRSIERLRRVGIERLSVDLIFAIPGQTLGDWKRDLETALALGTTHVSAYALTYEPNTPLAARRRAGTVTPVDEDIEAAMYEHAQDALAAAGFEHYEISNWARPGERCRHNLIYWTNRAWWPLGPSAAGHVDGVRWRNVPRLNDYLESGPWPTISPPECLDEDGRIGESFMLGLRLMDGMTVETVEAMLTTGARAAARRAALDHHRACGRLTVASGRWRFTRPGRLVADTVLADLL